MQATVVITSKNRCQDLVKAVASALAQTAKPEVLVIDDGSTDDTSALITREFPAVRLQRSEQSLGLVVQRNRAARMTRNPILFSMDDDAIFSTPHIVEQTLREFDHPQIGAVAIPFIDVNRNQTVLQKAPHAGSIFASYYFIGTAHALRRELFLQLGGYRDQLVHQGEEEDYCIRMLDAGWITRCGNADPIHHFESPRRSWSRMDFYGARNKVFYAWQNVPWPRFPVHLAGTTVFAATHSGVPRRMFTRVRGVLAAYRLIGMRKISRAPVRPEIYRLSRELKRRGAVPLEEIKNRLTASRPLPNTETSSCVITIS